MPFLAYLLLALHRLELRLEPTRILAIRHGETAWNKDTRIQGQIDIPLNDTGHWQAERAGAALRDEPVSAIYSSDLSRALQTAQAISRAVGLPVATHTGLRERCFGEFEGRTWAELEEGEPEHALQWRRRVPHYAPAGGESLLQLQERVMGTFHALASQHPGEQIVVVAHGGVLDILYRAATQLSLQAPRSWLISNAAINRLLWTPESLTLVGWADAQHLEQAGLDESTAA